MATITIDFEVTNTDFSDIVGTALMCIDYWADDAEFQEPYDAGFEDDLPAKLSLSCEEGVELYEVTKADAEKAMVLIAEGKVTVCDSIRADIRAAIKEDDYGNVDGYAADAIIQIACFGELIYG